MNGVTVEYMVWCIQPTRGQYVTIRSHVFRQQDINHPLGANPLFTDCLSLCEVKVFVKGKLNVTQFYLFPTCITLLYY